MNHSPSYRRLGLAAAMVGALAACGGSASQEPTDELSQEAKGGTAPLLIRARVRAAQGGTFANAAGTVTVSIPAGALGADATLLVEPARRTPAAGALQTIASPAFEVRLKNDDVRLGLAADITVAIRATAAPVPPQLPELASADRTAWTRLRASFYRPSTQTVVGLTRATEGTYAAVYRTRQLATGPAVARGYEVFRDETFGNEAFFGAIGLQDVLNAVTPAQAVGLGAQVDVTRVPAEIVQVMVGGDHAAKRAALEEPAVARALIQAGAVIGVKGFFEDPARPDRMTRVGLTCALCHETVEPMAFELVPGEKTFLPIGFPKKDGVPNAKLDAGAILAATPFAQGTPGAADMLNGWGPGNFDVRALPDNPMEDGVVNPTNYPPMWNFIDLEQQGYLFGWDGMFAGPNALASQAEAVYDLILHGNGAFGIPGAGNLAPSLSTFFLPPPAALVDALVAAEAAQPGNDLDTGELLDLQSFMQSIASPPPGAFDEVKAEQGWRMFHGTAGCASCHQTADLTGPGLRNITGDLAGGLAGGIRIPSLRGVSKTAPYLHDGRVPTLEGVVSALAGLGLQVGGPAEQAALVEYLKSL